MSDTVLRDLYQVVLGRKAERQEGSYTCYLFDQGLDKILKKVGEESAETIIAAKNGVQERTVEEISDLLYHLMVLLAAQGVLHVVHVGDSRAYLRHQGVLSQITMDHSYVQDLVNFGQITPEEARVHPKRNIITRVLGVHEQVQCDYGLWDLEPGDIALACSDGLSNYMDEAQMEQYLEQYGEDGKVLSQELIRFAVESGGSDNITVAVISDI